MSEAVPEPAEANVLDYVAAWNEPDAATRLKILERCWADDGAYVDPNVELRGRSALCQHISTVQAGRPGARLEMMSGVELHHHVVRFLWRLVRADGRAGDRRFRAMRSCWRSRLADASISRQLLEPLRQLLSTAAAGS
jgi:SnoaL-like domain